MKNKTVNRLCINALGIAMYVVLSMMVKIPIIGNISLDLGYVVLAVFCYMFGGATGAVVGACGCALVSLLTSGWFPPGWFIGNIIIGLTLGFIYKTESEREFDIDTFIPVSFLTFLIVFLGIGVIKSLIESWLFNIPIEIKLPKNTFAALTDATCMFFGLCIAPMINRIRNKIKM